MQGTKVKEVVEVSTLEEEGEGVEKEKGIESEKEKETMIEDIDI